MRAASVALALVLAPLPACGDDDPRRPIGATCDDSGECQSGLCRQQVCVDPFVVGDGSSPVVAFVTRDNTGTNISVVTLDLDGALVEAPESPFQTDGGNATEVAFTPDGAHAYVGSGSNGDVPVHALDLPEGDYFPATNPNPPLENSSGLKRWDAVVIHPSGAFVYAADAEGDGDRLYTYAVDSTDAVGSLVPLGSTVDVFDVTLLDMDPLGAWLIAANGSSRFGIFPIGVDGALGAIEAQPAPDFVRSMRFAADGESVYLLTNTGLHAYGFDRETGALDEVVGSPFAVAGGDVLEVDPKGRFLYETGRDLGVFLHRINPTGTVALVDIDDDALNGLTGYLEGFSDLAFGGGGSLLYATGDTTASFTVDTDGLLTLVATLPISGDRVAVLSL